MITNEEAIEMLNDCPARHHCHDGKVGHCDGCNTQIALNMAIAALKAEPCEDAVSRKRVKYLIHTLHIPKEYEQPLWDGLDDLPPAFPTNKKSYWMGDTCHNCGYINDGFYSNYCPDCGAKMEGESK